MVVTVRLSGCLFHSLMADGKMNAGRHLSCGRVADSVACGLCCTMLLDVDTVTSAYMRQTLRK